MRTAIVRDFPKRFANENEAEEFANEVGGTVCHLLKQSTGLQCTFGYGIELNGTVVGSDDYVFI